VNPCALIVSEIFEDGLVIVSSEKTKVTNRSAMETVNLEHQLFGLFERTLQIRECEVCLGGEPLRVRYLWLV
jgi:hypothetical protein